MNMTHCCEDCRRVTELYHVRATDQYLCEDCIEALVERLEAEEPRDPPGWEGGFAENH